MQSNFYVSWRHRLHFYDCIIFSQDTYVERKPGESSNDRNDRSIRVAADWYGKHVRKIRENFPEFQLIDIVLLSNDSANRQFADEMSLKNAHFESYVTAMKAHPHLVSTAEFPNLFFVRGTLT